MTLEMQLGLRRYILKCLQFDGLQCGATSVESSEKEGAFGVCFRVKLGPEIPEFAVRVDFWAAHSSPPNVSSIADSRSSRNWVKGVRWYARIACDSAVSYQWK